MDLCPILKSKLKNFSELKLNEDQNLSGFESSDDEKGVKGVTTRSKGKRTLQPTKTPAKKRRQKERQPKLVDNVRRKGATFAESLESERLQVPTSDRNRRGELEKERIERVRKVSNKSLISPL